MLPILDRHRRTKSGFFTINMNRTKIVQIKMTFSYTVINLKMKIVLNFKKLINGHLLENEIIAS